MAHKIQIKRGNKADLPVLNDGELGLCLDTNEVYVGNNGTNVPVGVQTEIVNNLTETVTGKALDATQGKALAEQISTVSGDVDAHKAEMATESEYGHVRLSDLPKGKRVARFVIGTSTAGWTAADCDYLCDGTADQVEINNAITALPVTGGEIVILDGTYNITAKINVTKDNVSIRGNGSATMLKRMFNSSVKEGVITLTGRSGCKIANLQVDGNKTSYTNNNNYGIYLYSSSDNTVTGNTCNNNRYSSIYLSGSNNNTITGNNCNNNERYGIYLSGSNNNIVTGNTCNDNNNDGIYLNSSSSNIFTDNNCNNNVRYGIYSSNSNDNAFTGNTCNNNNYGIYLGSNNNTATGNTCNNNSHGIYLDSNNNTITGNTCNNNNYGINLSGSRRNTVTGNTCIRGTGLATDYTESQHTIRLSGTGNSYNLISNNNCMGKAVTSGGGTGNTLVNNKFDDSDDITKKNLLHNWDFRNPVNQRGVSGTISTAGYFLDRWKLISGTVTINSGSITLNGTIAQILEVKAGTNTKASTLCQSGTATASYNDSTKTFTLTSSGGILLSAKLEIGSTSTLANDPPADYGEQLALCQRYQLKFGAIARYRACQIASNVIDFFIPTPTTIRVNPTIDTDAISVMNLNGTARTGFTFTTHNAVDSLNGFVIRCIKTGHGMTDAILSINTGTIIDANL